MSTPYYLDYHWKNRRPQGIKVSNAAEARNEPVAYKIVSDPYHRQITIERYEHGLFLDLVYDSSLLDFKKLSATEQVGWEKSASSESEDNPSWIIRNQDDRVVYIEYYTFDKTLCRGCEVRSPHGILLSKQKIYYQYLGDPVNGVILIDANDHPVMYKQYEADEDGTFTQLLLEVWEVTGAEDHPLIKEWLRTERSGSSLGLRTAKNLR